MLLAIATGGLVAWADADWSVARARRGGGRRARCRRSSRSRSRSAASRSPLGPWRDYVTLTKPRIMSLLLLTGAAGMFVGAGGWPGGVDARGDAASASRSPAAARARSTT